jgi:sterol-4alpha-carboxylate 3-dehydrogenase (decarboxylating)
MVSDRALRTADNFILGTGDAIHDWVPVECVANAHVMAEEALLPEPESLRDHTGKRAAIGGEAFFIGNNETHTYGWFFGQKTCGDSDALSHWQHRQPKNIPLPIVNMLTHINLFCYNFFGGTPFPRELAPSLVQYTQRSFTFRYDKATKYFGYKRILTVEESIKQLLKRYEAEEATVGQR